MGRLRRLRVHELAEERPPALLDHPEHLLQLRVGVRHPRLRRQGATDRPQDRGQSAPSGQPRPHLRQGRRHAESARGSRSHPVSARAATASADRASGGRCRGTKRSTTSAAASARRSSKTAGTKSCITSAGPARTATPTACCRRGASTATTATPTSARRRRGSDTFSGAATIGRRPTTPTRRRSCCCRRISRPGHYFNPHAQRIIEGQANGATLIVIDPRLSNTSAKANVWLPAYSGTEGALLLAMVKVLLDEELYDREFVRDLGRLARLSSRRAAGSAGDLRQLHRRAERAVRAVHAGVRRRRNRRRRRADRRGRARRSAARAAPSARTTGGRPRPAICGAGRSRAACICWSCSTGSVGTKGGVGLHLSNKFVPKHPTTPPPPDYWNELLFPREYPLAFFEMSFLLPHFLKENRGKLDVYFTRVYNPVWTNPDGFSWMEMLTDRDKIGLHVALTPTWSETAWFADYILPMGLGTERHDTMSQETHAAQWLGFRQPVLRVAREKRGEHDQRHLRGESGRGVGGERVLGGAHLAHRSRRRARHPQAFRIAVPPGRAGDDGRVLRVDVRELGARACPKPPRRSS